MAYLCVVPLSMKCVILYRVFTIYLAYTSLAVFYISIDTYDSLTYNAIRVIAAGSVTLFKVFFYWDQFNGKWFTLCLRKRFTSIRQIRSHFFSQFFVRGYSCVFFLQGASSRPREAAVLRRGEMGWTRQRRHLGTFYTFPQVLPALRF